LHPFVSCPVGWWAVWLAANSLKGLHPYGAPGRNSLARDRGDAPESLAPFLAGAGLTALPKKNDDIRPVAVGETWRRLTAKTLCAIYKDDACKYFFPLQIGVGLAIGTEVGISVARQWCKRHVNDLSSVLVLIDFANAFNCVDREAFLSQCRHHFPGLSRWVEYCCSQPSRRKFPRREETSQEISSSGQNHPMNMS
jgi:hypothetical protein